MLKVTAVCRVTRDPEVRNTPNGASITEFSIVENKKRADKEYSTFLDVKAFGKQGEFIAQYVKKGGTYCFNGSLDQETWEDKTSGDKRSRIVMLVDSVDFIPGMPLAGANGNNQNSPAPQQTQKPPAQRQTRTPARNTSAPKTTPKLPEVVEVPADDDIPF